MALEIERRFLVEKNLLPDLSKYRSTNISQGYLTTPDSNCVVRIRRTRDEGFVTIKTQISQGVNNEFEYQIPYEDASSLLLSSVNYVITKDRYYIPCGNKIIELDWYKDRLDGIVIAEIELTSLDERIQLPAFISKEITYVKGLSNYSMSINTSAALEIYAGL